MDVYALAKQFIVHVMVR